MVKKRTDSTDNMQLILTILREEARSRIEDRVVKGTALLSKLSADRIDYESIKREYHIWDDYNVELLKRIFSKEDLSEEYSAWLGAMVVTMHQPTIGERIGELHDEIGEKIDRLKSIKERLELIPEPVSKSESSERGNKPNFTFSNKVFIVHGHDEIAKTNLEIFLTEIGLKPIVLHRQADEGLTIIEKFEKHAEVGYAFILLTPDEVAYLAHEDLKPDGERNKEKRARPNVIFEFGYFVGKLGRARTCCLYTGGVSLPSDIGGMIYKKYEKSVEEVAYGIIKDLRAVGIEVNMP